MKNKKWTVLLICMMLALIPVFLSSCIFSGLFGTESSSGVKVEKVAGRDSGKLSEEEFEELLENEDFLETFDTFYYPDSRVEEARAISGEQDMVYVILETDEAFDAVERLNDISIVFRNATKYIRAIEISSNLATSRKTKFLKHAGVC